jgi:hypothetical protein
MVVSCLVARTLWPSSAAAQESDESAKIEQCRQQLDACVRAAEAPESINSCSEQEARCIANAMKVTVPDNVPVGTLTQCAATATDCALLAPNADTLNGCTLSLASCINGVATTKLTCTERWTQCVADQPLLFPICSFELLGCTD